MTAPFSPRSVVYTATAGQTVFDAPFYIGAAADVTVTRIRGGGRTVLANPADYTLAALGLAATTITLAVGALLNDIILVEGAKTPERLTQYENARAFDTAAVNAELDNLMRLIQEVKRDVGRAVRRAGEETAAGSNLMPKGKTGVLQVDASGNIQVEPAAGGGGGVTFPILVNQGGTGATDAAGARTNLGLGALATKSVVGSADITDLAVDTADLKDRAVTKAKLATGTPNNYLGFDALGAPVDLPKPAQSKIALLGKSMNFGGGLARRWVTAENVLFAVGVTPRNGYPANTDIAQRVAFNIAPATIVKVISSASAAYVLDSAGRVWSFGGNANGELGHGDTAARTVATRVEYFVTNGLTIVDIYPSSEGEEFGDDFVFFKTSTNVLYACGANNRGQLGLGDTTARSTPTLVPSFTDVLLVAPGSNTVGHALAIKNDGTLWAAGENGSGQLGLGDTADRTSFTQAPGFVNAAQAIACGGRSGTPSDGGCSFVRKTDGTVWSTGQNARGQLGLGDTTDRSAFVQIAALSNVVEISVNGDGVDPVVAARTSAGNVLLWGQNGSGAVGDGTTTNRTAPFQPSAGFQGKATKVLCSGAGNGQNGVHILTNDNEVWAAGYSANGNLGTGSTAATNTSFQKCVGLTGTVADISAGGGPSSWGATVLYSDGRVGVCGDNSSGQLGLGVASADAPIFYDAVLLTPLGVQGPAGAAGLDITGLTAETAPAVGDETPIYDVSATANRKMTLQNLLKVVDGLSEDTAPDGAADFALTYDTSAGAAKKVKPQSLKRCGGLQLLASGSVSNAATLDIVLTSFAALGYRAYMFVLTGLVPATDAVQLQCRLSTDGGANYDTGATDYAHANARVSEAGTGTNSGNANDTKIILALSGTSIGNASDEGVSCEVLLFHPTSTALRPRLVARGDFISSDATPAFVMFSGGGSRKAAQDTDAIRFLMSSGNIASGEWAVYGMP